MKTVSDAKKYKERCPDKVTIERQVRYFANVEGIRYALVHDWELQIIENQQKEIERLNELLKDAVQEARALDDKIVTMKDLLEITERGE